MDKFNPFKPGKIIHPAMFSGRQNELLELEKILFQTKSGNATHFLIHGERGIGKSSLLMFIDRIARGEVKSTSGSKFGFLVLNVELTKDTTLRSLIVRIGSELQQELTEREQLKAQVLDVLDFISKWKALGVEFKRDNVPAEPLDNDELLNRLVTTVGDTYKRLSEDIDGIILLIDEADKASSKTQLGEFVKIFTERLDKKRFTTIALGLSGISTVVDTLRKSHESSVRILKQFRLEPLTRDEAREVVEKGLIEAKKINSKQTTIDEVALDWIAGKGSEGYPHFIQEYAFHAFDADTNFDIDLKDLNEGVYRENGALDQLGMKYFENMYIREIQSDDYRSLLHAMSDSMSAYVTKDQLRDLTDLKDHQLNNAISTLKQRRIIIPKPGVKGEYRLPSNSFAVWIKNRTEKEGD